MPFQFPDPSVSTTATLPNGEIWEYNNGAWQARPTQDDDQQQLDALEDRVTVNEEEIDDLLIREGQHLHYELYISFPDAALGTTVEIPSVNGKVRMKIDSGTQGGKTLRLKGKGLPSVEGYGMGDLLVHVSVWTPKSLTSKEKSALNKLGESDNFKPNPGKLDKGFFQRVQDLFS